MNQAEKRARITRAVPHYQQLLGLERWTVHFGFKKAENKATCEAQPEYRTATLNFDLSKLPEPNVPIERTVLHELVHCLTWRTEALAEAAAGEDSQRYELVREIIENDVSAIEGVFWETLPRVGALVLDA